MSVFVAVDVETADSWVGSICQIGLVSFEGGQLVRKSWLVDPQRQFSRFTMKIHGLNAKRVSGSPTFRDLHPDLMAAISGKTLVCFTDFDARAIGSACLAAGLPYPESVWIDAYAAACAAWPDSTSHTLRHLGGMLGIKFASTYHDATEDALAAAFVFLRAIKEMGITTEQAAPMFAIRDAKATRPPSETGFLDRFAPKKSAPGAWIEALSWHGEPPQCLGGEVVVFTGDVPFARAEMETRIKGLGGRVTNAISTKTTLIVSGWDNPAEGGTKLKAAGDLILQGHQIRYMSGDAFLALVDALER